MIARGRSLAAGVLLSGLLVAVSPTAGVGVGADGPSARTKAPRCTIVGTAKADRLVGTPRRDVICGRGGNDVIIGRGGNDVLRGGAGKDSVSGGGGRDRLLGGSGDDDLIGGPAADDIDGGSGFNQCATDATDVTIRCAYDLTPPTAVSVEFSTSSVDVADHGASVVIRIHVADDTGVTSVGVLTGVDTPWLPNTYTTRVSGTARDGWWEGTLDFNQSSLPGTYRPRIVMEDRVGRHITQAFDAPTLAVLDDHPDLTLPEVTLLEPTNVQTVDTRTGDKSVPVRARITDAGSGVDPSRTNFTLWMPSTPGDSYGGFPGSLKLVSGTAHDGIWAGRLSLRKNSTPGRWSLSIMTSDLASAGTGRFASWVSTQGSAAIAGAAGEVHTLPEGTGSVVVLGAGPADTAAPTIRDAAVSSSTVSTLSGPATVQVTLTAADAIGVSDVHASLVLPNEGGAPLVASGPLVLTTGTSQDGVWTGTITIPQGYPPGTYYLGAAAFDNAANADSYISSQYPGPSAYEHLLVGDNTTVTVVDASAG